MNEKEFRTGVKDEDKVERSFIGKKDDAPLNQDEIDAVLEETAVGGHLEGMDATIVGRSVDEEAAESKEPFIPPVPECPGPEVVGFDESGSVSKAAWDRLVDTVRTEGKVKVQAAVASTVRAKVAELQAIIDRAIEQGVVVEIETITIPRNTIGGDRDYTLQLRVDITAKL